MLDSVIDLESASRAQTSRRRHKATLSDTELNDPREASHVASGHNAAYLDYPHKVKDRLQDLTRQYGERALGNEESRRRTMRGFKIANGDLTQELCRVTEELKRMKQRHDSFPATVPVRAVLKGEKLKQVHVETRRLIHCFRIAVFRAESALRELLTPHYQRWRQDGRTIIQSMLQSSGNLEVEPGVLRVILAPQSAPHRSRALALLCEELNALGTRFPGSDLLLNFSVQGYENVS